MALNIKNPIAERLAHELAAETGGTLTDAIIVALRSHLVTVQRRRECRGVIAEVEKLQAFLRTQPDRDPRSAEEILGDDDFGLPV